MLWVFDVFVCVCVCVCVFFFVCFFFSKAHPLTARVSAMILFQLLVDGIERRQNR